MRTVPALAITLLAPFALVAPEADSVRTERPSVESLAREPAPAAERPAQIRVSARPIVTTNGATANQQAQLDEALALFREHGLDLPDVDVRFSLDQADCAGNLGIFENSFTPWRLSICTEAAFVPTHELAHAWEAANLDDDARARYVEARGLTNWNDRDTDWADRGVEDAARIMQQNLTTINPILSMPVWVERLDAYELLVGRPSPLLIDSGDVAGSHNDPVDDVELVEPLTPEEQALVEWATDRFARAGLALPELTVRFDPTRTLCNNAEGLYRHEPTAEPVVTVCTPDLDTFAARLGRRRTLLHEFGHAWDFANMTTEDHHELARILGADAWNDHDDVWADRGIERFAETFVFALLDQPRRQLKVGLECPDLISAFRAATGTDPLGPGLPPCAADDGHPDRAADSVGLAAHLIIQNEIDTALAERSPPAVQSGKPDDQHSQLLCESRTRKWR